MSFKIVSDFRDFPTDFFSVFLCRFDVFCTSQVVITGIEFNLTPCLDELKERIVCGGVALN